jgi:hypothetical protein
MTDSQLEGLAAAGTDDAVAQLRTVLAAVEDMTAEHAGKDSRSVMVRALRARISKVRAFVHLCESNIEGFVRESSVRVDAAEPRAV